MTEQMAVRLCECGPCASKAYSGIGAWPWTCRNGHTLHGSFEAQARIHEDFQRMMQDEDTFLHSGIGRPNRA